MRSLFIGVSLLALMAPSAYAQQTGRPVAPTTTPSSQMETGKYLVFFDWNKATLTPEARRVIGTAADNWKKTGNARIVATGYTDLSGTPAYNQKLSERRADAVAQELVRLGVPSAMIATVGKGESDPLVPTRDGVREAQNRRVEIVIPQPPRAVEAPPPRPAPTPVAAPPPPPPPLKWEAALGGFYGYNFKETDQGNNKASHLPGIEASLAYYLTPNLPVKIDQVVYNTLDTSHDDGFGGRSTAQIALQGNFDSFHPYIGANGGYIYGKGVQDGWLAGPELGAKFDFTRNFFGYAKAAYDFTFRNNWDEGIPNGGLGVGYRF